MIEHYQVLSLLNFLKGFALRGYFNVGFRTDRRDTFFCLAKRKYPKKRPPDCRLHPALQSFYWGLAKGASCPFANSPHPCGDPNGLFPVKALVLGAANGKTTTHFVTSD
jgi:hypothetical protein